MRKHLLLAATLASLSATGVQARPTANANLTDRIQTLEDRAALRQLFDTFSNLADTRDISAQVRLFTPDASVASYSGGKLSSSLKGREQIAGTFTGFLAQFETVYHQNGQQTVEIHGDHASGTGYAYVVLVRVKDGKRVMMTNGVVYKDEYVRQSGQWLIARRTSNFVWRNTQDIN